MGLENLKSVFNDLSENQISNPSKLTPHASRLDDIEDNLISDPNPRAGMLHGILTEGDQYVFELPNPPDKKPLTGRDTSDYNDILKHSTIDPKSGLHSPVSDLSQDSDSFTTLPFPKIDSVFANKSIRLRGGESLIDTEIEHTFGFSVFDELLKQTEPIIKDPNSPLSIQDNLIEFNSFIGAKRIGPQSGYSGGVSTDNNNPTQISFNPIADRKKLRTGDDFLKLGKNNRLGEGKLILETLYNVNHSAKLDSDRLPIVIRPSRGLWEDGPNGVAGTVYTWREGMGALENLDIMGYTSRLLDNFRGFYRGNEPYVVQPIGSDRYTISTNRDTWPVNRALDDTSRLLKFYTSWAGASFLAKENITNRYGAAPNNNPGLRFMDQTLEDLVPNLRLNWLGKILAPPLPNPIDGNTGFLNQSHQHRDLGPQIASLRMPGRVEYSKRTNIPTLPFGFLGDNPHPVVGPTFEQATLTRPKFLGLGDGPRWRDNDRISDSGVEFAGTSEFAEFATAEEVFENPLEDETLAIQKGDFYVRIKDLRNNKFIYFRGYVTGITENVNPSWSPTNYVGRSEPVYLYERAERDLSFNLRVYPANNKQFKKMYEKINYLTSLVYPEYLPELDKAAAVRMKAPFTELYMGHIGSRVKGQFGFIKSITYTINETGDWDAVTNLPRLFDVAITYQILSKKPPSLKFTQPTADSPDSFYPAYKKL